MASSKKSSAPKPSSKKRAKIPTMKPPVEEVQRFVPARTPKGR